MKITDIKCGLLSKHLFQRTQQHGYCIKPKGDEKFVQKIMSYSYHME